MGTTSDKLTYLNETKTQIKDNLNFGGANITNETFREYADKIKDLYVYFMNNGLDVVWNNWEKVIGSGTSITLNQTMEAPMKIDLKGNTSQNGTPTPSSPIEVETTTGREEIDVIGKNLFDYTTSTFSAPQNVNITTQNNTITITTTETTTNNNLFFLTKIPDKLLENGETYTISSENVSGVVQSLQLQLRNKDGSYATGKSQANSIVYDSNYSLYIAKNIFATSNISIPAGTTAIIKNVQVEKSNTPSTYEEYKSNEYEINLGKNLFDINNKETKTGIIYNNGFTLIKTTNRVVRFILPQTLEAGTYTISFDTINYVHTLTNSFFVSLQYSSDYTNVLSNIILNNNNSATFTAPSQFDRLYFFISNSEDNTATITIDNIQLEKGNQSSSFSPYKTPIELCKIGDYQDSIKKTSGKNLLKFDNANNPSRSLYTYTTDREDLIVCTKNATGNDFYAQFITYLESGKTYTLSVDDDTNRNIYMYSDRLWGTGISGLTNKNAKKGTPFTFTSSYTGKAVIGFFGGGSQTLTNPMLNEGSTALPYEPYGEGQWYIHKEIGRVVLNGSESYATGSLSGYYRFQTTLSVPNKTLDNEAILLSNNFKGISFNNRNAQTNETCFMSNGNLSFNTNVANSENSFKTWLGTHNTDVYYILNTPTNTLITDYELIYQLNELEKAKSYDNTTNILQANDNLPFILDVRALKKIND